MPAEHSARGLVEAFPAPRSTGSRRVLFPCADLAPVTIPDGLAHKGWDVRRVEAYRTVPRAAPEPALVDRVAAADALTFTATSAVQAFLALRTAAGEPVTRPGTSCALGRRRPRRPGRPGSKRARGPGRSAQGIVDELIAALGPGATTARRLDGWSRRRLRPLRAASRCGGCAGCAARRRCGGWSPRPVSGRTTWSPRSSCGRASTEPVPIASMPGEVQHSLDSLVVEAKRLVSLGVPGLILFGVPARKDAQGSGAWDPHGVVQVALRAVRDAVGDELVLMADLCLDEYTDHGHCGVLGPTGEVLNDATLELYQRIALAQAEAGADVVAPSGMMDGQVAAIRAALDGAGHDRVAILAYASKYASALYGPFRDAVDVTIAGGGDRRAYQQDPRNGREALAEIEQDVAEGADMIMVKPAMTSLDVLAAVRAEVPVPLAAYHVSGEFAMVKAAAAAGWIDGPAVALEQLTVLKRAGADFILTYFAAEVAEALGG